MRKPWPERRFWQTMYRRVLLQPSAPEAHHLAVGQDPAGPRDQGGVVGADEPGPPDPGDGRALAVLGPAPGRLGRAGPPRRARVAAGVVGVDHAAHGAGRVPEGGVRRRGRRQRGAQGTPEHQSDHGDPCHGTEIRVRAMPEPAIALKGVERRYGERVALSGVEVELAAGQTLAVLGANGAGKTTLLRVLATLLRPHAGSAMVLGVGAARRRVARARAAGLPGPRPAAVPRAQRAPEPGVPRAAARRGRRAGGRAAGRRGHGAPRRQPGARALARHGPAAGRRAGDAARPRPAAAGRAARRAGPGRRASCWSR